MGCASSKQSRCRHCQGSLSPVPRSYSMHVHHPPQSKGDSYHVVALTSTTLGTLKLDSFHQNHNGNAIEEEEEDKENKACGNENVVKSGDEKNKELFSMGLIEAKTWSSMINEKIPKIVPRTPIRTPPGEPETINAWELMEGLEDTSPLRPPNHLRSFSFDVDRTAIPAPFELPKSRFQETRDRETSSSPKKPMWLNLAETDLNPNSNSRAAVPEFDPEVISMFRNSLQEFPSDDPFQIKDDEKVQSREVMDLKKVDDDYDFDVFSRKGHSFPKETVVVYFTSLRGVRKTYEDCCHVRVILKSLGIRADERDVSMHSGFKEELKDLLGEAFNGGSLPRVFLGKRYIGGAEDIRRMHEEGQLEKTLENSEKVEDGGNGGNGTCEACGDIRFVPCETCSGSCKIYYEAEEEDEDGEEEEEEEEGEFGFQRCPDCNENGLIRCPICCY